MILVFVIFKIFTLQKSQNSMFLLICQISWFAQLKLYDDAIFKIFRFAEITKFYVFTHLTNFMICALSNCIFTLQKSQNSKFLLFWQFYVNDLYNNKIMKFLKFSHCRNHKIVFEHRILVWTQFVFNFCYAETPKN